MTTHTLPVIEEFAALVETAQATGEALNLSPCEALGAFFPAIVGDDDIMGALAMLLEPVLSSVAVVVATGVVDEIEGEKFVHGVYHLLQIAAAMGHMIGVCEAMGMAEDIPADLSDLAWGDLPDVLGEE